MRVCHGFITRSTEPAFGDGASSADSGIAGDVGNDLGVEDYFDLNGTAEWEGAVADVDADDVGALRQLGEVSATLIEVDGPIDTTFPDELDDSTHGSRLACGVFWPLYRARRSRED